MAAELGLPGQEAAPEVIVLGLGNLLCSDDGLGIEAVRRLAERYRVPDGVQLLDGGTLGLGLVSWIAEARQVLIVDAVSTGEPPGSFVRLEAEEVGPAVRERLSVHQVGVADLLDALRLIDALPERLLLLGLVPESIELGLERTAAVDAALPELVERVAAELAALGFEPIPVETTPREERPGEKGQEEVDALPGNPSVRYPSPRQASARKGPGRDPLSHGVR